jgi:glycosyltransferase involved in cell wall biosynthesis
LNTISPLKQYQKISIITPSYNQGQYLEETILSVIRQGYPDLEHIIIDGGSKDQSLSIIEKYQTSLSYWVSEPDSGQSQALNKGFQRATGSICMWLNSDDTLLPGTLEKVNAYFNLHPETDLLHGRSILFGKGRKEQTVGKTEPLPPERYLAYIPFPQPSSFFTKKLFSEVGPLNEQLHYGMDYEFLAKACLQDAVIRQSPDIFSRYRLHYESKSHQELLFSADWAKVFSKVLRSQPGTEELILLFSRSGLYDPGETVFPARKIYSETLIRRALVCHLLIQAHFFYNALDLRRTAEMLSLIFSADREFYEENDLKALNLKARFLPAALITFMRKFTRN